MIILATSLIIIQDGDKETQLVTKIVIARSFFIHLVIPIPRN